MTVQKIFVYCENSSCNIIASSCTSEIDLSRSLFIFTPSNKKVTITRTIDNDVTIGIRAFADLVAGLVRAPEYLALNYGISQTATQQDTSGIQNIFDTQLNQTLGTDPSQEASSFADGIQSIIGALPDATSAATDPAGVAFTQNAILGSRTIGVGLFDGIVQNELHARVCASAALTLADLQATSIIAASNIATLSKFPTRALYSNATNNNLYLPRDQAYMPTYFAATFCVFFVILSCLLLTVDLVSFRKSLINVKDANELAFIDNIGSTMAARRSQYELSNDPDEQERVAFDHYLYCREGTNSNGDVVIYIEYEDKGQKPKVDEFYH